MQNITLEGLAKMRTQEIRVRQFRQTLRAAYGMANIAVKGVGVMMVAAESAADVQFDYQLINSIK
jgi:hypothetical protein